MQGHLPILVFYYFLSGFQQYKSNNPLSFDTKAKYIDFSDLGYNLFLMLLRVSEELKETKIQMDGHR